MAATMPALCDGILDLSDHLCQDNLDKHRHGED